MTAPQTYLRTNQYKIPRGRVALSRRRDDGTYEGFQFFGNCPAFTLSVETENYQHTNSEGGLSDVDLDVPIRVTRTSNITCDNVNVANMATWLGATVSSFTQNVDPVTGEVHGVLADRTYQLGEDQNESGVRNVGSVTVALGADNRANNAEVAKGDVVVPAVSNGHIYVYTVAGVSANAPPTLPTDGTTVADGTATLLDLGEISALVAGVDYVIDNDLGLLSTPVAGKIGAAAAKGYAAMGATAKSWGGIPLEVGYTPAANTRVQIRAGNTSSVRGKLKFFADNIVGEQQDVLIPDVTLSPSGELPFVSNTNEAATMEFLAGISLLNNQTTPVLVENRGA